MWRKQRVVRGSGKNEVVSEEHHKRSSVRVSAQNEEDRCTYQETREIIRA